MDDRIERVSAGRAKKAQDALRAADYSLDLADPEKLLETIEDFLTDLLHYAKPDGGVRRVLTDELPKAASRALNRYEDETRQAGR